MKITKQQLKRIIKEEMENLFREQEEITTTKRTFGDKLTAIVNAWGGYRFAIAKGAGVKEAAGKLIEVLKSFKVPKETAMKIYKAEKQEDVAALVKGVEPTVEPAPAEPTVPGPAKPAEKGEDKCAKAKEYFRRWQRKGNIDNMRKGKKLIDKYCK